MVEHSRRSAAVVHLSHSCLVLVLELERTFAKRPGNCGNTFARCAPCVPNVLDVWRCVMMFCDTSDVPHVPDVPQVPHMLQ